MAFPFDEAAGAAGQAPTAIAVGASGGAVSGGGGSSSGMDRGPKPWFADDDAMRAADALELDYADAVSEIGVLRDDIAAAERLVKARASQPVQDRLIDAGRALRTRLEVKRIASRVEAEGDHQPSINAASRGMRRDANVEDTLVARADAVKEKIAALRAKQEADEVSEMRSTPAINARSRLLAERRADTTGDIHDRLVKRKAASEARNERLRKAFQDKEVAELRDAPEINTSSKRRGGQRSVETMMAWEEKRQRKLDKQRAALQQAEAQAIKAGVRTISKGSERIVSRMREKGDPLVAADAPVGDRLFQQAQAQERRAAERRAEAEAEHSHAPVLAERSAAYIRGGDAAERLYHLAPKIKARQDERREVASLRQEYDESTGRELFKPRINPKSAALAANRKPAGVPVEDVLTAQGEIYEEDRRRKEVRSELRAIVRAEEGPAITERSRFLAQAHAARTGQSGQARVLRATGAVKESTLQTVAQPTFRPNINPRSLQLAKTHHRRRAGTDESGGASGRDGDGDGDNDDGETGDVGGYRGDAAAAHMTSEESELMRELGITPPPAPAPVVRARPRQRSAGSSDEARGDDARRGGGRARAQSAGSDAGSTGSAGVASGAGAAMHPHVDARGKIWQRNAAWQVKREARLKTQRDAAMAAQASPLRPGAAGAGRNGSKARGGEKSGPKIWERNAAWQQAKEAKLRAERREQDRLIDEQHTFAPRTNANASGGGGGGVITSTTRTAAADATAPAAGRTRSGSGSASAAPRASDSVAVSVAENPLHRGLTPSRIPKLASHADRGSATPPKGSRGGSTSPRRAQRLERVSRLVGGAASSVDAAPARSVHGDGDGYADVVAMRTRGGNDEPPAASDYEAQQRRRERVARLSQQQLLQQTRATATSEPHETVPPSSATRRNTPTLQLSRDTAPATATSPVSPMPSGPALSANDAIAAASAFLAEYGGVEGPRAHELDLGAGSGRAGGSGGSRGVGSVSRAAASAAVSAASAAVAAAAGGAAGTRAPAAGANGGAASGTRSSSKPQRPLPAGWTRHVTSDHFVYYYHEATGESRWTRPALGDESAQGSPGVHVSSVHSPAGGFGGGTVGDGGELRQRAVAAAAVAVSTPTRGAPSHGSSSGDGGAGSTGAGASFASDFMSRLGGTVALR